MNTSPRINLSRALAPALAAAAALLLAAPGHADVITAEYVSDSELEYEVRHMPDLDQNRAGYAPEANNGKCYCSPTAAMNAIMYIANHGFLQVAPGPGIWSDPALYVEATMSIEGLAADMNTSPGEPPVDTGCGTGATGGYNGLKGWLQPYGIFIVNDHESVDDFTPDFASIAKSLIGGNLGTMSYGAYTVLGDIKGVPVVNRGGGHVVTPVRMKADGGEMFVWARDPDDESSDLNSQSPFASRMYEVTNVLVIEVDDADNPIGQRWASVLDYSPGDDDMKIIDGHRWIRLKEGYTLTNDGHGVLVIPPVPGIPLAEIPSPTGQAILSIAVHPEGHSYLIVSAGETGGPNSMHQVSALTGEAVPIETVPSPLGVIAGPNDSVYSTCITDHGLELFYCWSPGSPAAPISVMPPFPFQATAYDDAADEAVLLSTTASKLMRYPADLSAAPTIQDIPTLVPLGADPRMAINPTDGKVWVLSDDSDALYGLSPGGAGGLTVETLLHPLIVDPEGLDFDDRGHLFVATGGAILELEPGLGGAWQPVAEPLFAASPAQGLLLVARSRTNATTIHDGPDWLNIPSGEREVIGQLVPDCNADLNGDGLVGITDFLQLLGAWGPCGGDCAEDLDHDEIVGITDFLLMLSAWGPCA